MKYNYLQMSSIYLHYILTYSTILEFSIVNNIYKPYNYILYSYISVTKIV